MNDDDKRFAIDDLVALKGETTIRGKVFGVSFMNSRTRPTYLVRLHNDTVEYYFASELQLYQEKS